MMKRLMIPTLVIGTLAAVVLSAPPDSGVPDKLAGRSGSDPADPGYANSTTESDKLRTELKQARTRIQKLEQELSDARKRRIHDQNTANFQDSVAQPCAEQASTDYEMVPQEVSDQPDSARALEVENAFIEVENDYWREPQNNPWSEDTRAEIEDFLTRQALLDTSLNHVECHSSICLVEFAHTEHRGHENLLQHLSSLTVFSDGFLVRTDESSGEIHTLVYFPQKGKSLPLPMQPLITGELK